MCLGSLSPLPLLPRMRSFLAVSTSTLAAFSLHSLVSALPNLLLTSLLSSLCARPSFQLFTYNSVEFARYYQSMLPKNTLKQKKRFGDCRKCLICGGKTISAHLGMDVCRACSVFYRRSVGKRVYECRSNSGKCDVEKGATCRKCRFERIETLLANTGLSAKEAEMSLLSKNSPPDDMESLAGDSDHTHRCEPSGSSAFTTCNSKPLSVLERVQSSYRTMAQIRLTSELLARPEPPHPMFMNEEDCVSSPAYLANFPQEFQPYEQGTFGTMQTSARITISSILVFGKSAFPEFACLSKEHQWTIAVNFFFRFGPFESSYRADRHFPQHPERLFAGYTLWFTHHYDERYFSDCPNPCDVHQAKTSMRNHCEGRHSKFRSVMKRLKLAESEFFYVAAIMFWTTEGLALPDDVMLTADKCRASIMQELHVYFREVQHVDDYAARLGELLTALQFFDKSDAMKENFEFLRLINVFSDDTFVYRLMREDAPASA
ncbi:hypothetical protein PENTCL1PPCAC_15626 [Pristionchus entomophagus]|uniref:Nuclear receptor n=1 Tax=Pristionchus entomophagus TaxID=358040 RepID=A0AAV5TD03_9BILA|nr:hypothetical protein PENTCL1PPCAC_15626 [Pristionchus entomophagus]